MVRVEVPIMRLDLVAPGPIVGCLFLLIGDLNSLPQTPAQPELGHRSAPLLKLDGLQFKDLDQNGALDPYEDWRLSPEARAADLVGRMSLEEAAGIMVLIHDKHANTFITRLSTTAKLFALQSNDVQGIAESFRWQVPVTISSDPRHHFQKVLGASSVDQTFSHWPEPLGFAAANDEALTRSFGDAVRQEYAAVGIRESLAPQADLATEPRWARANGTFGEDAEIAKRMVFA